MIIQSVSTKTWAYPSAYGTQYWNQTWLDYYEDRQGSTVMKRKKPVGIEKMFAMTEWYKMRYTMKDGVHMYPTYWYAVPPSTTPVLYPIPGGVWGTPGAGMNPPYGPSKYPPSSINDLLLKIKGSKINIGMVLAEYKQTCSMFVSLAQDLLNIYRGIRKGKLKHLLKSGMVSAPDTWMMYRYGITPFVSDVQGMMQILDNADKSKTVFQRFSSTKNLRSSDTVPVYYAGYNVGIQTDQIHVRRKTVAYVEYTSHSMESFTSLGLTNPLLLGWEVIPYSFVIDWFIGIGDYLSSLDALVGTNRVAACVITKYDCKRQTLAGHATAQTYSRVPITLAPEPPQWDPSLNWKRVTDSLVMLRNIRR